MVPVTSALCVRRSILPCAVMPSDAENARAPFNCSTCLLVAERRHGLRKSQPRATQQIDGAVQCHGFQQAADRGRVE